MPLLESRMVPYDSVWPNDYNPNVMTPAGQQLLRRSLLEDGWTAPLVILETGEIVDGEQRWAVAGHALEVEEVQELIDQMLDRQAEGENISQSILTRLERILLLIPLMIAQGTIPTIASILGGKVPVTHVDAPDRTHRIIVTVRMNRARGIHGQGQTGLLLTELTQLGMSTAQIGFQLNMTLEEVKRNMASPETIIEGIRASIADDYTLSWEPVNITDLTEDELAARDIQITPQVWEQEDPTRLRKWVIIVSAEEHAVVESACRGDFRRIPQLVYQHAEGQS